MRTIKSEFPDYDNDVFFIPPFICEPWHNDACPRYVWRGDTEDLVDCELTLWVEYRDPAKRENYETQFCFTVGWRDQGALLQWANFETEAELRTWADDTYGQLVGYRPGHDFFSNTGQELNLGQLLHTVGTMIYLRSTE